MDVSAERKRKKVTELDVFQALSELGFDKYNESLKEFMKNYTEKEDEVKKQMYKKRKDQGEGENEDAIMESAAGSKTKRIKENFEGEGEDDC